MADDDPPVGGDASYITRISARQPPKFEFPLGCSPANCWPSHHDGTIRREVVGIEVEAVKNRRGKDWESEYDRNSQTYHGQNGCR